MTSSHGLFELKVDENKDKLLELLTIHEGINTVKEDHEIIIATLNKPVTSSELNSYMFKNGIILSHLVKRKPSLEQQFLTLTSGEKEKGKS
jgi:ABC-2 type transport system ATP-binding protein